MPNGFNQKEDDLPSRMEVLSVLSEELSNCHLTADEMRTLSQSRIFRELMQMAILRFYPKNVQRKG